MLISDDLQSSLYLFQDPVSAAHIKQCVSIREAIPLLI